MHSTAVKVTEIKIFNSFIKVLTQNSNNFHALKSLKKEYDQGEKLSLENITLGQIYIFKLDDHQYWRVRVKEKIRNLLSVWFIDYGNQGLVSYNQVRMFSKTSNSKLRTIPAITKEYILAELILSSDYHDYRSLQLKKLHEMILNKIFDLQVLSETEVGTFVNLKSFEASFANDIIPNHPTLKTLIKRIKLADQIKLVCAQQHSQFESNFASNVINHEQAEFKNATSFQNLIQGSIQSVKITEYKKGPKEFYAIPIINIHSLNCSANNVIHSIASRFCLSDVEKLKHFDDRTVDFYFQHITKGKELKLQVDSILFHQEDSFNTIYNCTVFYDERNILDKLIGFNPHLVKYSHQIPLSREKHKVKVCSFDSLKTFYVNVPNLENLENSIVMKSFEIFNPCVLQNPSVGNACCVNYLKRNHRGIITAIEREINFAKVRLVDIGIIEDFPLQQIMVMVNEYSIIPPRAFLCCFDEFRYIPSDEELENRFKAICDNELFTMYIIDWVNGVYYVKLETKEGKNMVDILQEPNLNYTCEDHSMDDKLYLIDESMENNLQAISKLSEETGSLSSDWDSMSAINSDNSAKIISINSPMDFLVQFTSTLTAITCSFPVTQMSEEREKEATDYLQKFVGNELKCYVIATIEDKNFVNLYFHRKNLCQEMLNLNLVIDLKVIPDSICYIVHVVNLKEFYIHLDIETIILENIRLLSRDYEHYKIRIPIEACYCMAKSKKFKEWFRAKIVSVNDDGVIQVQYLDFGNKEKVEEIGSLHEFLLAKTKPLAHFCSLNLPKHLNPNSKDAIKKLKEMIDDGYKQFSVSLLQPKIEKSVVSIIDFESKKDILDILQPLCEELNEEEIKDISDDDDLCSSILLVNTSSSTKI